MIFKRALSFVAWALAFGLLSALQPVYGADPVKEQTIDQVGTPTALAVSSTTWTKVPKQMDLRAGTLISNALTSGSVFGILWTSTSTTQATPTQVGISTTAFTLELAAGDNPLIANGPTVDIYLVAGATRTVTYQEVSQNLKIR